MDAKKMAVTKRGNQQDLILQVNLPAFLELWRTNAMGRGMVTGRNADFPISSLMQIQLPDPNIRRETPQLPMLLDVADIGERDENTTDIATQTTNTASLDVTHENQGVRQVGPVDTLFSSLRLDDRDEVQRIVPAVTSSTAIAQPEAKKISGEVTSFHGKKKYRFRQASPKARKATDCGDRYAGYICNNCYQEGHILRLCPKLTYKQQNMRLTCSFCNQRGHVQFHCPQRSADSEIDQLEIAVISAQNKVKQAAECGEAQLEIAVSAIRNLLTTRFHQLELDVQLRCDVAQRDFVKSHGNPAYPTRNEVLARHVLYNPLETEADEKSFRMQVTEMLENFVADILDY